MMLLEILRNIVGKEDRRKAREAVRVDAVRHAILARQEVKKARNARELAVLEEQYRRRIKARGIRA